MIPSLAAEEIRRALIEYLTTSFALSDDDAREALRDFLLDESAGMFRGPFLRVHLPFRQVDRDWISPLDWSPRGFTPYEHQAAAWERLSSRDGSPQPTLITTGTGSGKTEAFLYPILDDCRRRVAGGERGIKALILYPMNALAGDQAARLAGLLASDPALAGITAGVFTGAGEDTRRAMGPGHLIESRHAMRERPPDILLTNYRMLDLLLLREEDRRLWANNGPGTLRYLVLDELHTYDGAQGTDVAMLLRRLGARLGMARPGAPLGDCAPVGTSATLGSGEGAGEALLTFARRVFGVTFTAAAVIGEARLDADVFCGRIDYGLPIPDVATVTAIDASDPAEMFAQLAAAFLGEEPPVGATAAERLGQRLRAHPLTRALLDAIGDRPRSVADAVGRVARGAPSWGQAAQADPAGAREALLRFLALISRATLNDRPMVRVEAQVWVREIRRLTRAIQAEVGPKAFRWQTGGGPLVDLDSTLDPDPEGATTAERPADTPGPDARWAPAIRCDECGASGWMAMARESDDRLVIDGERVYRGSIERRDAMRALMLAPTTDDAARWFDPARRRFTEAGESDTAVPVYATPGGPEAERQACPACDRPNAVRFIGSRVTGLAAVAATNLFASDLVAPQERKLLVFSDSVQDAAHQAGFLGARAHRFNLRGLIAQSVGDEPLTLDELPDALLAGAGGQRIFGLCPPDLLEHPPVASLWGDTPDPDGRELFIRRLAFEAALEFGLRSRTGRTLELSGVAAAEVAFDPVAVEAVLADAWQGATGLGRPAELALRLRRYVRGLLERLRTTGAIEHPWLETYIAEAGNDWRLGGGRVKPGMPGFGPRESRPRFLLDGTAKRGNMESLGSVATTPSWTADWAMRCLGVADLATARKLTLMVVRLLAHRELLRELKSSAGAVYGLAPDSIRVGPLGDDHRPLRCDACRMPAVSLAATLADLAGGPCLRYRCPGTLRPAEPADGGYYRDLYRRGDIRRIVGAEHTGLLDNRERAELERRFRAGTEYDAPNAVACTPTLEMGIDIGDLSAVFLTSLPRSTGSYLQRVGRAGRRSGNALVVTFAPADALSLHHLEEPEGLIAGEVTPPDCHLDATEILHRQYLAFLIDRVAADPAAPKMPAQIGRLVAAGSDPGTWLAAVLAGNDAAAVERYLGLLDDQVGGHTVERFQAWAAEDLARWVSAAIEGWQEGMAQMRLRRERLGERITKLSAPGADRDEAQELDALRRELRQLGGRIAARQNETSLKAIELMGLLPNYTLFDDGIALSATIVDRESDDARFATATYRRGGSMGVAELAPGNTFYAGGHRHQIDAIDMGGAGQLEYEQWRLCPGCGYGDRAVELTTACPRCGNSGLADRGARHWLHRLREVTSIRPVEDARIHDQSETRERTRFALVETVDVDPAEIVAAWERPLAAADAADSDNAAGQRLPFGVEHVRRATIRRLNLGRQGLSDRWTVAGDEHLAEPFTICRDCGAAADARRPKSGVIHRGWCVSRGANRKERLDKPVLYHQLETEAVRMLLPIVTVDHDARLASAAAALRLGLRRSLGGEPDNLRVTVAAFPWEAGGRASRRRMLVLYDAIPGGTGYLAQLAEPDALKDLLHGAREAIRACPCVGEGKPACHRCLLAGAPRHQAAEISRVHALELLDELLDDWELAERADPITGIDIGLAEESELERLFRAVMVRWAEHAPDATLAVRRAGALPSMELRIAVDGQTRRYEFLPQETLATHPPTRPDYLIRRQDRPAPEVALYLDGYEHHAKPGDANRLADDAAKRAGVRASGRLVWSLTWDDVRAFETAFADDDPGPVASRSLLDHAQIHAAAKRHEARPSAGRRVTIEFADRNPLELLIVYLRYPDVHDWEELACSVVTGAATGAIVPVAWRDAAGALREALAGEGPAAGESSSEAVIAAARTLHGAQLGLVLDRRPGDAAERWIAVLAVPDDDSLAHDPAADRERWHDWHQWGHLLQFLRTGGRAAAIETTSRLADLDWGELGLGAGPASDAEPEDGLGARAAAEMDLILDAPIRALAGAAVAAGAPTPVAGFEPEDADGEEGWMVEAAWPDQRVALVAQGEDDLRAWLTERGWRVGTADEWTSESLVAALGAVAA